MAEVTLVAGLGFGDEGKGTTIDWLARSSPEPTLVVRYNGGAQAAHNVVSDGRHHTFAQLGSATFLGVPTLLSRFMLVNPVALVAEARHLESVGVSSPLSMLRVEGEALVTTPFHIAMNRLREMARTTPRRHGSCGMGIGETMEDSLSLPNEALRVCALSDPRIAREKLGVLRERKLVAARGLVGSAPSDAQRRELDILEDVGTIDRCLDYHATFVRDVRIVDASFLADTLRRPGQVFFEGAQGVLLDQDFGFQPHVTWTNITFDNAHALLADVAFAGCMTKLGIVRAYATRHGAGPFVTEDRSWDRLSSHDHNRTGEWQGTFRSGAFDLVATRYALDVLGPLDGLIMTNLDRVRLLPFGVPVCGAYIGTPESEWFGGGRDVIRSIRVRRPFSLAHQELLTKKLLEVRPSYEGFARRGYASAIAERLGVPLFAVSTGPTAADKRIVRTRIEPNGRTREAPSADGSAQPPQQPSSAAGSEYRWMQASSDSRR